MSAHSYGRGESNLRAKLSEEQVREIRARPDPYALLARMYGVSSTTIYKIKRGEIWSWVSGPVVVAGPDAVYAAARQGAKLCPDQVLKIRASTDAEAALAVRYGVNRSTISRIRSGKLWARLPSATVAKSADGD